MSWFRVALILHLIGVLALAGAIALELAGVLLLRTARTVEQVRSAGGIMRRLPPLFGSSSGLILLSGIYMMVRLHSYGWTIVALVAVVLMSALGSAIGKRHGQAVMAALKQSKGSMTSNLQKVISEDLILRNTINGACIVIGLTAIMVAKPTVVASVIVLVVAVLIGFAISARLNAPAAKNRSGHAGETI